MARSVSNHGRRPTILILSRKLYQPIHFFLDGKLLVTVTVTDIQRGTVKLGVTAPREVEVMRDEILTVEQRAALGEKT